MGELLPGGNLGEIQPLDEILGGAAWPQRLFFTAYALMCAQAERAEAVDDRPSGERGELAQGANSKSLERPDEFLDVAFIA